MTIRTNGRRYNGHTPKPSLFSRGGTTHSSLRPFVWDNHQIIPLGIPLGNTGNHRKDPAKTGNIRKASTNSSKLQKSLSNSLSYSNLINLGNHQQTLANASNHQQTLANTRNLHQTPTVTGKLKYCQSLANLEN